MSLPGFQRREPTQPTLQEYCTLQGTNFLSPLTFPSYVSWELRMMVAGPVLAFPNMPYRKEEADLRWVYNVECLVPLVLSFELSHHSGTRGKSPFGRLSRHFMKFKHLAFQHSLFSAWSEKVLTAPSLTQWLSNPAGSPWFTPVLCKYSKILFFFFLTPTNTELFSPSPLLPILQGVEWVKTFWKLLF